MALKNFEKVSSLSFSKALKTTKASKVLLLAKDVCKAQQSFEALRDKLSTVKLSKLFNLLHALDFFKLFSDFVQSF